VSTLSRILQRLGIVVGAFGLIVVIYAFVANYGSLTAPRSTFDPGNAVPADDLPASSRAPDISDLPVPPWDTVEGRRKAAWDAMTFDVMLFSIPVVLLFALAWVVKPVAKRAPRAAQISPEDERAARRILMHNNIPLTSNTGLTQWEVDAARTLAALAADGDAYKRELESKAKEAAEQAAYDKALAQARADLNDTSAAQHAIRGLAARWLPELERMSPAEFARRQRDRPG
jgi:hypothetical protein